MNTPFHRIRHLKPSQVAQRLCVTEGTLERWRVQGIGPWYLRLPGRVRYRLADIEAFERRILCASTSREADPKETLANEGGA